MHRWSPIPLRWSVGGLSLVRLLVTRLLVLLLESWSVFRRWSICSSLIGPSTAVVVTGPTAGLSARSSLVHPFGSCHSCVCSTRGRSSVCSGRGHWLARPWLVCCSCVVGHGRRSVTRTSLVRLLDSSLVCRWCVVGVSLTCRWCVTDLSLVCRWCVTGPSLIHLLICLVVRLFESGLFVAGPSLVSDGSVC